MEMRGGIKKKVLIWIRKKWQQQGNKAKIAARTGTVGRQKKTGMMRIKANQNYRVWSFFTAPFLTSK
jgi:hypothetical protein